MSSVYVLNQAVAIEDFGDRSLALHCLDLRLVELNATARDMLARLDGQVSLSQVAAAMAQDYEQPLESIAQDVQATITQMAEMGFIEQVDERK